MRKPWYKFSGAKIRHQRLWRSGIKQPNESPKKPSPTREDKRYPLDTSARCVMPSSAHREKLGSEFRSTAKRGLQHILTMTKENYVTLQN